MDESPFKSLPRPGLILKWNGLMYVIPGQVDWKGDDSHVTVLCGGEPFARFKPGSGLVRRVLDRPNLAEVELPPDTHFFTPDITDHFVPYRPLPTGT